jgi:outer membrane protein assembly factor BamB
MAIRQLCFAALVLLAAALTSTTSTARADALTFQANAQHTGFVPGGLAANARRRWAAKLDGGVGYPVVAAGKVFVATQSSNPFFPAVHVVALSLANGKRVWQRELTSPNRLHDAALAVDGERVFVTRDAYTDPEDGALIALSAVDGHTLWQTTQLSLFASEPPVVSDGVVYLSESGGGSGGISAWRATDGANVWRVFTDHGGGGAVALSGDTAYLGVGCEPHVFRVRRSDGTPLVPTSSSCSSGVGVTPVIDGQRLLLRADDLEGVYDLEGNRTGSFHSDYTPAVAGGLTLVTDARIPGEYFWRGHTLSAVDARGKTRWRFRGDGYLDSAPLIAGRTVYVGSGSGRVYGLDLRSGRLRWRGNAGTSVPASRDSSHPTGLAAAGKTLLVPARGRLVAFR